MDGALTGRGRRGAALRAAAVVALAAVIAALPGGGDRGAAHAQRRPLRVGVLNEAWAANHPTVEGLKAGLRALGLEEGRDVAYDIRFTEGRSDALPAAAAALVGGGADLIFTCNEAATLAAKAVTATIPIVFTLVGDPVAAGIVKRLSHPDANVTGVSSLTTDLVAKRLETLKRLAPRVSRVWALYHVGDLPSSEAIVRAIEAAPRLGLDIVPRTVNTREQLEAILRQIRPGDGLLPPDIATMDIPAVLLEASLASRIPAVFTTELWVSHGALASYGADYRAQGVQAARLAAKVLRGARAQDLPVEGAHKIALAVNLKTATLLELTVPRSLMLRADRLRR